MRYSRAEMDLLSEAADQAGLSISAYLGQAGTDVAAGNVAAVATVWQRLLFEVTGVSGVMQEALRLLGTVAALLEESGVPGPALENTVAGIEQAAERADGVVVKIARRLR